MPSKNNNRINLSLIHEKIFSSCEKFKDKTALKSSANPTNCFSYGEIKDIAPKLAGHLKADNIDQHSKVGLLSENRPEWGVAYISILCCGATVVPLDPSIKSAGLMEMVNHAQIKALFISARQCERYNEVLNKIKTYVKIISLNDIRELVSEDSQPFINDSLVPQNPAVLIYTSGTTGNPKAVILTHENIIANLESVKQALPFKSSDVFLSLLPLFHTFEATCGFLTPLVWGMTVIYARSLKSKEIIEDAKKYSPTWVVGVPLLFEKMYQSMRKKISELSPFKRAIIAVYFTFSKAGLFMGINLGRFLFKKLRMKAGLNSIGYFVSGSAPLPPYVAEWFNLIGFKFLEGYGMTECSPVISVNRPEKICFGSVGPPLPNVEIKINNPTSEGIGEILVKGNNNTPGYLGNKQATDELLRDGWLYTGDLGKIENGFLYIKGRAKNLIVSGGGKNIHPEELEDVLNRSPYILETLVLGRKESGKSHESIFAIIVPDMEKLLADGIILKDESDEGKIKAIINTEVDKANNLLSNYKRVVHYEIRFDEFEKTSTKKIKRTLYK